MDIVHGKMVVHGMMGIPPLFTSDNKVGIFNHNCKNGVLLGHIKEHCGLHPTDNIDLSDEEGHVKQLHDNLDDYGTKFLEDREILVLLRVNTDEEVSILKAPEDPDHKVQDVTYTPLLEINEDSYSFLATLNPSYSKVGKSRANRRYDSLITKKASDTKPKVKI